MTTPTTVNVRLKLRSDTAANWTSANPTLLSGELGRETDTGKIKIGNGSTAWTSLAYQPFGAPITNADISATAEIAVSKLANGTARQLLQTDAAGTGVEWASNVDIPGTLDVTGAATFDAAVTIAGDLTVNGTTTNINTTNLVVEDKNIILGDVTTPSDITADGGGITLKSATDKTINWVDATDAWTSSERFSYPLGSATAPALTFTGDPNTGIYSPGADQVAISTDGTARLTVDNSGRLLVGTTTAVGNSALQIHQYTTNGGGAISLRLAENASAITVDLALGTLNFGNQEGGVGAQIRAFSDAAWSGTGGSDNPSRLVFFTTPDGASSPTERMRITASGRVGIGTSIGTWTPGATLDVRSGSNNTAVEEIAAFARPDALVRASINKGVVSGNGISFGTTTNHPLALRTNALERIVIGATGTTTLTSDASTAPFVANIGASEVARIDDSGRLLVGTSTTPPAIETLTPGLVRSGAGSAVDEYSAGLYCYRNAGGSGRQTVAPRFFFARSRSAVNNATGGVVLDGDDLGNIRFVGDDGTNFITAAEILVEVDGTPGTNDMPGRIVLSTTPDGTATPVERFRITNDGVKAYDQPAPAAVPATATLTVANLKTGIITSTSAAATDMTLPTGTDTQAGFGGTYDNFTFEWSVINTGPSLVRVLAGTAHTIVGSGSVATGTSGRFASRRTAANTFVTYRLS